MKKARKVIMTCLMVMIFFTPLLSMAAAAPPPFDPNASDTKEPSIELLKLQRADVFSTISGIINYALTFLGLVALVLMLYAGAIWMLARGNEEEVRKAQDILKGGFIGLVIILGSYAVSRFVFDNLVNIIDTVQVT